MKKEIIGWLSKRVLLPLTPFLVGAVIRYLYVGSVQRSIFDPAELSFSMAMLSLLVLLSIGKLDDRSLAESLSGFYTLILVMFLVFFSFASFLKAQFDSNLGTLLDSLEKLQVGQPVPDVVVSNVSNLQDQLIKSMLLRTQLFVVILTLIVILLTVIFKQKYRLED